MTLLSFARQSALRWVTIVAIVSGVGATLIDGSLAAALLFTRSDASAEMARSGELRKQISDTRRAVQNLGSSPPPAIGHVSVASGVLKRYLDAQAAKYSVEVMDFQATDETSVFVTRYAKNTKDVGWSQTPVRVVIQGAGPNLISALEAIRSSPVPLELDAVDLNRLSVDSHGRATVSADVDLRVLTWGTVG